VKIRRKVLIVAVLVVSAAAGALVPAAAQGEPPQPVDPGQIPTLPDFLEMLAGPAGWVMLGMLASMLLKRWAWYNEQSSEIKRGLPVVAAALLSIIARLVITYVPADFWIIVGPYWVIIAGTFSTWIGSQLWYHLAVRPKGEQKEDVA
jgi:hypothetical protein